MRSKRNVCFQSGYSFNDILQYFHTHLTKNHGECTGSSDHSERARLPSNERYSLMGDNYLSLTLTLVNDGGDTSHPLSLPGGGWVWGLHLPGVSDKFGDFRRRNMFQGMRALEKG